MNSLRSYWTGLALLAAAGCAYHTTSKGPAPATSERAAVANAAQPSTAVSPAAVPAPDLATNPPPRVSVINSNLPSLFVAGDSTAARGAGTNQQGWAVPFANYFDPAKVNVVNRARGGRSSRTFVSEGLWDSLLADVKAGDIVLIQFGHNDGGAINDASRARGSLRGVGDETEEIDNQLTKKHEVVHTYGWYLRKMVEDTKAKGARPIILSTTARDVWKNGNVERGPGRYSQWASEVAKATRIPCVDVANIVGDEFQAMGEEKMKALYPRDHTHFNAEGADLHAAAVVSGLKGLRPSPISSLLSAKGQAVKADAVSWLNLPRPADPALPTLFLIGDSTVRNGRGDGAGGQWGWGEYLDDYFDPAKLNVVNRAVGGTTSRSYARDGQWERVLAMVKPGDFVMMQFGHNDNGSPTNPPPGRSSIKGVGYATAEVVNPTNQEHEIVHTFGWYIAKYIADTRAKGATPIVCSLIPRKIWTDGKIARAKDSHAGWAEQAAAAEHAPFVDLNEIIASRYDALGQEKVDPLFADRLHTTDAGARLNAECVVTGLKALKENPLEPFFRAATP